MSGNPDRIGAGAERRLLDVYDRLFRRFGSQRWWPGDGPFETIVGAILTQAAAWTNVEKALANLKSAGVLSPEGVASTPEEELASLLRPSGYYNAKARKLKAFVELLQRQFGGDLDRMLGCPAEVLREQLLSTYGIGPETADSILLYAAGRPVFVIDAYTRRIFSRLGVEPERDSYDGWQKMFECSLPAESRLFNEYHALIVRLGKEHCRKEPECGACPLFQICPTGEHSRGLDPIRSGQVSLMNR
ncbi:MAG: endonuclease III domain-containing protein [Chloroflexi bacterium]|nr:endonuclease III domain-containing protein [Chloroflexota bacterium]